MQLIAMAHLLGQAGDGSHHFARGDQAQAPGSDHGEQETRQHDVEQGIFAGFEFLLLLHQHVGLAVDLLHVDIERLVAADDLVEAFRQTVVFGRDGVVGVARGKKAGARVETRRAPVVDVLVQRFAEFAAHLL